MPRPKCHICGYRFHPTGSPNHPLSKTMDHVVPKVLGGKEKKPAHFFCNNMKGAMELTEELRVRIKRCFERFHLGSLPSVIVHEGKTCRIDCKTGRLIEFDPKTRRDIGKVREMGLVKAPKP